MLQSTIDDFKTLFPTDIEENWLSNSGRDPVRIDWNIEQTIQEQE